MKKIKLAIADDCEEFRKVIIGLFHFEDDLEVIAEAENGFDLLSQLKLITPDIILMDINMPLMDGIDATNRIIKLYPDQKIIAFSLFDNERNILKMFAHGAKSFIGKCDGVNELLQAIRIAYHGGNYLTEKSGKIINRYLASVLGNG